MRSDYPPLYINPVFPGLGELFIIIIMIIIIIIIIIIIVVIILFLLLLLFLFLTKKTVQSNVAKFFSFRKNLSTIVPVPILHTLQSSVSSDYQD